LKENVLEYLKEINKLTNKIRIELDAPSGIRISVVNRKDFKVVEFWDSQNKSFVTLFETRSVEMSEYLSENEIYEGLQQYLQRAIELIPLTGVHLTRIEILSDLDYSKLSDEIKILVENLEIEYNSMSDETLAQIKERYDNVDSDMYRTK